MKNVFVIFVLAIFMLQSCKDKAPTVDFNNATFLSEQDILKAIRLNEIFLDSKLQKNNSGSLVSPIETSKTSTKEPLNQKSYAQTAPFDPCEFMGSNCTWVKGKINNDCIPKGGPCVGIRNLEWLILYYRNADFIKTQQIRLINLRTGKPLVATESTTNQQLPYTYFSVKSSIENKEPLGIQYSVKGVMKNIPVTY